MSAFIYERHYEHTFLNAQRLKYNPIRRLSEWGVRQIVMIQAWPERIAYEDNSYSKHTSLTSCQIL